MHRPIEKIAATSEFGVGDVLIYSIDVVKLRLIYLDRREDIMEGPSNAPCQGVKNDPIS